MLAAFLVLAGIACFALHTWCEINCTRLDVETGRRDPGALVTDYGSNRGWYPRYKIPSLAGFVGGIVLWIWAIMAATIPAQAHDHNRPHLNDWLKSLHSKAKTWCCDGNDTDAIDDWETKGNRYRVRFRGIWYDVPEDAVVDGPNKSGTPLLWMYKGYMSPAVRCFMPGSMT